jgi:hypothetical protein
MTRHPVKMRGKQMKMVLVFDTEDWAATRNSLKLAHQFFKAHNMIYEGSGRISFTKIPMIKMVRQVAREVESKKLDSSLRGCKQYVESRWIDWDNQ